MAKKMNVSSSLISTVAISDDGKDIEVEFKSGKSYRYFVHDSDRAAEIYNTIYTLSDNGGSVGSYVLKNIVNKYTYERI